jgi:hypothetical protein
VRPAPRRLAAGVVLVGLSLLLGLSAAVWLFLNSSRTVVLVGHDTVVRPTFERDAVVQAGPLLPDFRFRDVGPVGVTLTLGKTEVGSIDELVQRYAYIAGDPDAQIEKVQDVVLDMALSAALRGLGVGLVPVAFYLLLGTHRRGELFRGLRTRNGIFALALLLSLPVLVWQPWESDEETQDEQGSWQTLAELVGPDVTLPKEAQGIEVRTGPVTTESKRLVLSAVDTYEKSKAFYSAAAEGAADLDLRQPEEGETVALLVTDRHDNIGMDRVARAIGERAGATVVLDGGDDTSTGQPWEAFSLDSLAATFRDWDRVRHRRQPRPRHLRQQLPRGPGLDDARRRGRRGAVGRDPPRGRRPAQQRPGQLARRVGTELHRGRPAPRRRRLPGHGGRRTDQHDAGPRREPRA